MGRRVMGVSVAVLVLSILGFVASLVIPAFGGDYDKYGTVPVPGTHSVTLPAGDVDIYFVAYLPNSGGGGPVTIPALKFSMDNPGSARRPVIKESIGAATQVNTKEHIRVWKMHVEDAGTYTVHTDGDVSAYINPSLTFGTHSSFPGWLPFLFGGLFVVAILGIVFGANLRNDDQQPLTVRTQGLQQLQNFGFVQPPQAEPTPTPASTPAADLARLQQLDQLASLHAAGTLSDQEYADAKARLGG